jgi:hypothetical protein
MAADPEDPIVPPSVPSRSTSGEDSVGRRRFLQVLGAAGVYTPPALLAVLGESRPAAAETGAPEVSSGLASESSESSIDPLAAIADTTLRSDQKHTNEGANPRLRVGPESHVVVMFDRQNVMDAIASCGGATRVLLRLWIANTDNNWGQNDDRTVGAWPLRPLDGDFVEGNGCQLGQPAANAVRASGAGATWQLAEDLDCANNAPDAPRSGKPWLGATAGSVELPRTAPFVVHVNQDEDTRIDFDVTTDVLTDQVYAWRLGLGDVGTGPLAAGEDPRHPTVEYYSREGAAAAGDPGLAPRLVVSTGSSESSCVP